MIRFLGERGAATAVEVAMLAPVLILMIFGVIESGRALWVLNTIQRAAESTTRYAAVNSSATDSTLQTQAQTQAVGLNTSNYTVTITHDTTGGVNFVTVSVDYQFTVAVDIIGWGTIGLSGRSRAPFNN
ncbi:MAG: pilus assembly protein [Magnetovibrio sp.]|nr:pilus assembly protein [Magnetovibrio sp.]